MPLREFISDMSRYMLPLMLDTVNRPTASALGNTCRTSVRFLHRALLAMRYQASRGSPRSACSRVARSNFLRLMTCNLPLIASIVVRIMRTRPIPIRRRIDAISASRSLISVKAYPVWGQYSDNRDRPIGPTASRLRLHSMGLCTSMPDVGDSSSTSTIIQLLS